MKIKEVNYYGLDHDGVAKKFGGDLTYLRTFQVRNGVWAVYKAANPNLELGHKKYMMLGKDPVSEQWYVSGSTPKQMKVERVQEAVVCLQCNTVLYSIHRHHYHSCGCPNETFVDGGKDYLRYGAMNMSAVATTRIDLISGKILDPLTRNTKYDKIKPKETK
jgi:hypothetical protein